jgi:hypothetical protein
MKKPKYIPPEVLQRVSLELEEGILTGSVADSTTVQTAGQEVETYNFSSDSFNHDWE